MPSIALSVAAFNGTYMSLMLTGVIPSVRDSILAPAVSLVGTVVVAFVSYKIEESRRIKQRQERIEDEKGRRELDKQDRAEEARLIEQRLEQARKRLEAIQLEEAAKAMESRRNLERKIDLNSIKLEETRKEVRENTDLTVKAFDAANHVKENIADSQAATLNISKKLEEMMRSQLDDKIIEKAIGQATESVKEHAHQAVVDLEKKIDEIPSHTAHVITHLQDKHSEFDVDKCATVEMDEAGLVTGWDLSAERILGWKKTEIIGQKMSELLIPVRYREAHEIGMKTYLETRKSKIMDRIIPLAALRKDGSEIPIQLMIKPPTPGVPVIFKALVCAL